MKYVLTLLVCILASGQLQAEEVSSNDFAAGYYLEVDNNGAVYSLELPADVYRTVRRADLGDVRVFNSAGDTVPHGFRAIEPEKRTLQGEEGVPFFPLFREEQPDSQATLSLRVARNSAGTIVNIKSAEAAGPGGREANGYLLDLSGLKRGASELEFRWQKESDSSVFTINIQQSSDLMRWTPLANKETLVDLQYGGQRVEKRTVPLPRRPLNYLKLTWHQAGQPLRLTGITSFSQVIKSRQKHQWVSLYNGNVSEKEGKFIIDYEAQYHLPADSAQIRFSETNSIAKLSVQSRMDQEREWRTRCEKVFYNLNLEDTFLQSEPCTFQPTGDTLWRLVVQQDGSGLHTGDSPLNLELGWTPEELLFVGRGAAPFLLAFGSGKLEKQQKKTNNEMILQAIQAEPLKQVIKKATLGKRIRLGGDSALQPPPARTPWKKWLLWMVLVLGVGLLAFMTRSLVKEMKTAGGKW